MNHLGWEDYHELPEYLRFNKYGGVLTKEERGRVAKSRGVCAGCGMTTHKVTPFRSIPLENDNVQGGICLRCHPEHRKVRLDDSMPTNTSNKAAKLLGQGSPANDLDAVINARKAARKLKAKSDTKTKDSPKREQKNHHLQETFRDSIQESLPEDTSLKAAKLLGVQQPLPMKTSSKAKKILGVGGDEIAKIANAKKAARHLRQSRQLRLDNKLKPLRESLEPLRDSLTSHASQMRKGFSNSDRPQADLYALDEDNVGSTANSDNARVRVRRGNRATLLDMHKRFHSTPHHIALAKRQDNSNAAWDIVRDMRSHPDDINLLTKKCHELCDIGANQAGSLYEVIEVMRRFPDDIPLQIACIHALWSLSADGDDDSKTEIINADGAQLIQDVMAKFPEDETLLSSGFGALSNLGEGIGLRADLAEDGLVVNIETILKIFYNSKRGMGHKVLHWVLACLVSLVSCYDYTETQMDNDNIDSDEVKEDCSISRRCRDAIRNTEIVPLVLHAICTAPTMGITMEPAFKFLSHFDVDSGIFDNRMLLIRACENAIENNPHGCFPELHRLACAILCLMDPSDHEKCTKANSFIGVALDAMTYVGNPIDSSTTSDLTSSSTERAPSYSLNEESREVFICTISQLLYSGKTSLDSVDSEMALDICTAVLEDDKSSAFLQGSCCWIIWSTFRYGYALSKNMDLTSKAAEDIKFALPNIEHSPTLLTISFAALSEISKVVFLEADPLVESIVHIVTKYANVEMLRKEACQLLINLCRTEADAMHIVHTGGLDAVKKPLGNSIEKCLTTLHLMIKVSVIGDEDILSVEDLKIMINASVRLKDDSTLAAKSWISFLTPTITPERDDFPQRAPMALHSIKEMMESFPDDLCIQQYACLALRNLGASIQKANLHIDVSGCINSVLDAQKKHGVQIHKKCCYALWALVGVQWKLDHALMREIVYFTIEVTEIHLVSREFTFSGDIVTAGMAILAAIFLDPVRAMKVLGESLVDVVVDVLNKCIYSHLDRQEGHPSIYEFGFCAMQRLCSDDMGRDIIVTHGGIVAVVDGMYSNIENASIQENGCNILWRLAGNDLATKLNIVEADGVDVIMNLMITHGENANVLSEAFRALSCLSVDKATRNFIAQQGGVMLIVTSMNILDDSVRVQEAGLAALCVLASDIDADILYGSDIFSVVNDSLDCHMNNSSIQSKGLSLLYNLSMRRGGIKDSMSSASLKNVARALEMHTSCSKLVSTALGIMVNLFDKAECRQVLFDEALINLIISAVMLHIKNLKSAIVGCKILHLIYEKSSNKVRVGVGGLEATVFAMMFHHSSEYVQELGCQILARTSSHSFLSNGIFDADFFDLSCKVVDAIVCAMSGFPMNKRIQEHASIALRNMSQVEDNIVILLTEQSRLEEALTWARRRFPVCGKACSQVLEALSA